MFEWFGQVKHRIIDLNCTHDRLPHLPGVFNGLTITRQTRRGMFAQP
jgi:hypothetical protein